MEIKGKDIADSGLWYAFGALRYTMEDVYVNDRIDHQAIEQLLERGQHLVANARRILAKQGER